MMSMTELKCKKSWIAVLASIGILAGLAGCGKDTPTPVLDISNIEDEYKPSIADNEVSQNSTGEVTGDVNVLRKGINAFAYEMYERLEAGEDLFFSPYSLCTALSLLNIAAGSETGQELEDLLGIENSDAWNMAMKTYLEKEWAKETYVLTANSTWLQTGYEWAENIQNDFLKPVGYYYKSALYEVDFKGEPADAVEQMNGWVDKNTKGMIPKIIQELPSDMVLALMNAVYFEGKWEEPFLKEDTFEDTFYSTQGEILTEMMHQYGENYAYICDSGMKGISIPYKNADVVMKIFIPAEEGTDIETLFGALSMEEKEALLDGLDTAPMEEIETLALPKFTMEKEIKGLNEILQDMGMQTAFLPESDFDAIGEDIFVSEVLHKAKIEVDEQGTKAAAVTVIAMNESCAILPEEPITFIADRPFVYVLQDKENGMILFMGRVNNLK